MTAVAVGLGLTAALGGLTASYHLSSPPGATIALVAAAELLIAFAFTMPWQRHSRAHEVSLDAASAETVR